MVARQAKKETPRYKLGRRQQASRASSPKIQLFAVVGLIIFFEKWKEPARLRRAGKSSNQVVESGQTVHQQWCTVSLQATN
jgi:hypothetical protein